LNEKARVELFRIGDSAGVVGDRTLSVREHPALRLHVTQVSAATRVKDGEDEAARAADEGAEPQELDRGLLKQILRCVRIQSETRPRVGNESRSLPAIEQDAFHRRMRSETRLDFHF
jgi:4-hydroxyphenylpyruvate dioxygenase-like putative hemolysin